VKRFFFFVISYLKYYITSKDEHSIHSPFVFTLYTEVIRTKKKYYAFEDLNTIRHNLLTDKTVLKINDLGAGSQVNPDNQRLVCDIVKNSGKSPKISELLFRLTNHFKPSVLIDLGTSLGLTTLYFSKAASKATVYSFEGCHNTLDYAKKLFKAANAENIVTIEGNIDTTLPAQLEQIETIDIAYFDANHTYEATKKYFEWCIQKIHNDSLFIFDDIYWSPEMKQAWQEITNHPRTVVTIDLFEIGLVFFRKEQPKQHFVLKL
jgi:predicted O-methyltransferase YrrM